ncbi:MAG: putative lipid II flippase FtsW [Oscillospiraceae bacterium]|nr:putative lipid II flippase FtsW [Oscillospiraceae bacterium]
MKEKIYPKGTEKNAEEPQKNTKNTKKKRSFSRNLKLFVIHSKMDLPFMFLALTLVTIGLIMMFSASYPNAYYLHHGDSFFFIRNQSIFAGIGITAMLIVSKINYEKLRTFVFPVLIISVILLAAVLLMPPINGVRRWIQFGPIGFQPSEITKFAIVVSFSHLITKNFNKMNTFKNGILPFLVILAPTAALLLLEPHFSCTVIVLLLSAIMLYIGGVKLRYFLWVLIPMAIGVFVLITFTNYASSRISGWIDPFNAPAGVDTWQTRQGLYAIGSGGIFGLGLGNSHQKYLYIPEPQNDFIFAVVCEELGFFGAVIILILFAMLIWRGFVIALRAKDRFGSLLGLGLIMQIGLQVILNIAVVTNTIPNTGISLPFFSYGGTSLLMLLIQVGIILSISRAARMEKS